LPDIFDGQRTITAMAASCRLLFLLQVQSGVRLATRQRSARLSASCKRQLNLACMQRPHAGKDALLSYDMGLGQCTVWQFQAGQAAAAVAAAAAAVLTLSVM
jgi:hypothetical protein